MGRVLDGVRGINGRPSTDGTSYPQHLDHIRNSVSADPPDAIARLGTILTGAGAIATGVLNVIWGEFDPAHQPIQAWGDHIAHIPTLAYIGSALLVLGGILLNVPRTAEAGAATLTLVYGMFVLFPLPRVITAPHFLGHHIVVYIGLLVAICQQLILFVAVAAFLARLSSSARRSRMWARLARWAFGLCSIDFGLAHLTGIQAVARMVPGWMPFGGTFWTVITGLAFFAAGLSVIAGIQDVLAARLLGLMLLVFSMIVLTPAIFAHPHSHGAWGGDAYNLMAAGSAWLFASWLASRTSWVRNGAGVASPVRTSTW